MNNSKNTRDMTVGSPTKHILAFALPLLIGNVFQQLYNMVDSIVIGNFVGKDALAAVGTCSSMCFLFFNLSSGLAIGIGVIVSQYFGARDEKNVRATIANSFYVLSVSAVLVSILGIVICPWLFKLMQVPDSAFKDACTYMTVSCAGIIGIALYNGVSSILRALGDSRTPIYFLILSSIINVLLDLYFVLGLHWDVFGVALATIIAQAASAVSCLIYACKKVPYFRFTKDELKPKRDIIIRSFKIGVPVALQNSMISVSCMVLQGVVNSFGETVMASYAITGRIEQVVQQPYGSLGTALMTYSGQNMGAGKIDRVKKGMRQAVLMALIFSLTLLPIFYIFGKNIVGIFVKEQEVIDIAYRALRINSLCYFGLGMIYVPRALLNGCGDTTFSMINGFTEVACRIIYAPILTSIPALGYWGIWCTTGLTWITTGIVCTLRYLSGKWREKAIVKTEQENEETCAQGQNCTCNKLCGAKH